MRRLTLGALLCASTSAVAGPLVQGTYERGWERDGLVIFDLHKDGVCDGVDPWTTEVVAEMGKVGTLAVRIDYLRDPESVKKLVGDGFLTVPLRIAYLDGVEVDRACGCMDAAALSQWMTDAGERHTRVDRSRGQLTGEARADTSLLLEIVQQEYCANRHEAGFATLAGMWGTLDRTDDTLNGIRFGRVAHDMAVLARKSTVVTEQLGGMRDALEPELTTDMDKLDDWVALNRILLADDTTLAWFDKMKGTPEGAAAIAHQSPNLVALLVEHGRWADAGNLIGDPSAWLDWAQPTAGGLGLSVDSYAALIAAGRGKDAGKFAKGVLKVAPAGTACKLIARVVDAKVAGADQKSVAKSCDDAAAVAAWEAAQ